MPVTHVYFIPGLAAGKEIFRNIHLDTDRYQIHILEWLIPVRSESLEAYAERMAAQVSEPDSVLVGISFGGVMVQEMSRFLHLKKLIIISSVKTRFELPRRLRYAAQTQAYRLVPTSIVSGAPDLRKFAIGPRSKKRLTLYQEYLSVRDKTYLDWSIKQMVCWSRIEPLDEVVHIHGDMDIIFPVKNIKNAVVVEGGTHVMILNKGKKISAMLQEIIENK